MLRHGDRLLVQANMELWGYTVYREARASYKTNLTAGVWKYLGDDPWQHVLTPTETYWPLTACKKIYSTP